MNASTPYDDHFFDAIVGASTTSAAKIVPFLVEVLAPRSVVDVGCGMGAFLEPFIDAGVDDVLGVDGDYVDRARLQIPPDRFRVVDLEHHLDLGRSFDLALCFEVAEHLPESAGGRLIALLAAVAPAVAFSAAVPGQGGNDHVNEQWPDYWIERFASHGFVAVDCLRRRFWDVSDVAPYYAQNAFLFLRADHPARAAAEAATMPLPYRVVHPGVFAQRTRPAGLGDALRELPRAVWRSLAYRTRR